MENWEEVLTDNPNQAAGQQKAEEILQNTTASTNEAYKYRLKDAEPLADNMIIKVANFDQPSTRYYYTPYPMDANVLIYGEVVAVEPDNDFHIKPGDHVLYNGSIVYQSIEDGAKYVVGPVKNVLLVWRSKDKRSNKK
jgi:co-chaperonin GroES (HSP10)